MRSQFPSSFFTLLRFSSINPFACERGFILHHLSQQDFWIAVGDNHCPVRGVQKEFAYGMVEQLQEVLKIAVYIQHATWFVMNSELRPGQDFAEFVESTKSAWHSDETVRQIGHKRLALVHGIDHSQFRKALVSNLFQDQSLRNDSGDLATNLQCCIGYFAHKAHFP